MSNRRPIRRQTNPLGTLIVTIIKTILFLALAGIAIVVGGSLLAVCWPLVIVLIVLFLPKPSRIF